MLNATLQLEALCLLHISSTASGSKNTQEMMNHQNENACKMHFKAKPKMTADGEI